MCRHNSSFQGVLQHGVVLNIERVFVDPQTDQFMKSQLPDKTSWSSLACVSSESPV